MKNEEDANPERERVTGGQNTSWQSKKQLDTERMMLLEKEKVIIDKEIQENG